MKGDFSRNTFSRSKHYSAVLMQQGRVQVDADWNEQHRIHQYHEETAAKDVIGPSGAPLFDAGFEITVQEGRRLSIGRGRYYVDGLLCENENDVLYSAQPDFPNAPDIVTSLSRAQTTAGIVYLDVWRRHITAIDDPSIREAALGGPDTTTRVKTVWQVKVLPVRPPTTGTLACGDQAREWDDLVRPSTGALSARSQPVENAPTPCLIPPMAGYRRLENQLYRVEIHKTGTLGAATAPTFKWSRDNGSVVTTVERINGREVTVHDLGRDQMLSFSSGQWVEVFDETQELAGQPGQLIQIDAVDPGLRVITLKTAPQPLDPARPPKLRRWDSSGELPVASPPATGGWIALQDGVEVKFEAGTYATGDYWTIPARTATGNVDWPFAAPQDSFGIGHRYSRLAIVKLTGTALSVEDCRRFFAPLTAGTPALHVTGINWINDDVLPQGFDQLVNGGLQIVFDRALLPLPPTSSSAAVVVTMDAPIGPGDALTQRALGPLVLKGELTFPSPNILRWKPAQGGTELAHLLTVLANGQISRALLRVRLKGGAIWADEAGLRLYLDGQALGQPGFRTDGTTQRIDLLLPSGANARASDFDSWFYLQIQVPEANLRSLTLETPAVVAGGRIAGQIDLDQPAPAAGVTVTVTSSATTIASVPATVQVAAGQTRATFQVTTMTTAQSSVDVLITATFRNITRQASLRVQVITVSVAPAAVTLFTGRFQIFTASVVGAVNPAVTWSVQEPNGGSIDANGSYRAPDQAGTFHVIATSEADPNKRGIATITVQIKAKDKDKERVKEKEFEKSPVRDQIIDRPLSPVRPRLEEGPDSPESDRPEGRAFIRSDERPDVGGQNLQDPDESSLQDANEPPQDADKPSPQVADQRPPQDAEPEPQDPDPPQRPPRRKQRRRKQS
jgi:hypothetical protein